MPLSPAPSRSSRSSVIKTTEIGFAGVEGALRHFGGVTEEVLLAEQMTIRLARDHGFADSPLERAGFEPSVPPANALRLDTAFLSLLSRLPFCQRDSPFRDRGTIQAVTQRGGAP